jgi:hypothetical protein
MTHSIVKMTHSIETLEMTHSIETLEMTHFIETLEMTHSIVKTITCSSEDLLSRRHCVEENSTKNTRSSAYNVYTPYYSQPYSHSLSLSLSLSLCLSLLSLSPSLPSLFFLLSLSPHSSPLSLSISLSQVGLQLTHTLFLPPPFSLSLTADGETTRTKQATAFTSLLGASLTTRAGARQAAPGLAWEGARQATIRVPTGLKKQVLTQRGNRRPV